MSEESLKPDVKQAGLKILEKTASSLVSEIVTPMQSTMRLKRVVL